MDERSRRALAAGAVLSHVVRRNPPLGLRDNANARIAARDESTTRSTDDHARGATRR
jgi:hypothetical protein